MNVHFGLSHRDRRTLAIGLTTVSLLVLFARGMPALRAWESGRLSAAMSTVHQLALVRGGQRDLAALRDSLASRQHRFAVLDSSLLNGESPSGVAASLASMVEDLADDNALKINTLQLRADSLPTAGLARVEVRLAGVTDVAGLAGFLRAVETGAAPLVVRGLSVAQPEPAASQSKAEMLRVEFVIASIGTIRSVHAE
jgi:hypothetical protein